MDYRSRTGASSSRVVVKEEERSSFFQVPSHLVETYGGVMPSKVTLTTDESEKRWKLSVDKFQGEYFFTDGWKEFEEGVGLEFRRFLMYKPDASSNQKGKEKVEERGKISGNAHETTNLGVGDKKKEKVEERRKISGNPHGATNLGIGDKKKKKASSDAAKGLSFSKTMKTYHQYRLDMPGSFVRRTRICEKDIIILRDTRGKEWPVNVTKRAAMFSLCGGWIEFVADSKVTIGTKISFVWLSKSTILAQVLEVGTGKLLINSTSRRGKHLEILELSDSSLLEVKTGNDDEVSKAVCVPVGRKWKFKRVLTKANAYALNFPVSFSMVIGKKTSGEIQLMDSEGTTWPVKYFRRSSIRLTTGWIDFLVAHKARVGNTVVFKSLPNCNTVIKARVVMRVRTKQKELFVKKPRGRPSLISLQEDHLHASSKLSMSP